MAGKTRKPATKVAKVEQVKKDEVLVRVKDMTPKSVATKVAELQAAVSGELASVQARIAEQLTLMSTVDQAITIKQQELKELHGLADVALAQATLDDEIAMTREQWSREKVQQTEQWNEQEAEWKKTRDRVDAEWQYEFGQAKKQRIQALNDELANHKKLHDTQVEILNKKLDERQQLVAAAEKEVAELRKQGETFEARVSKEVSSQVAGREGAIKKNYEHQSALIERDKMAAMALAEQRVTAARDEAARLQTQVEMANKTIQALREDLKTVSTEAFRSVSGQKALEAVQQAAQASSGTTSTGKGR